MKTVYFFTVDQEEKSGMAVIFKPLQGSSEILVSVGRHVWSVAITDYWIGRDSVKVRWISKSADGIAERGDCLYKDDSEFSDEVVDNIFQHTIISVCNAEGYSVDHSMIREVLRC